MAKEKDSKQHKRSKNPEPSPQPKPQSESHTHSHSHSHHKKSHHSMTQSQRVIWLLNVIAATLVTYYALHLAVTKKYSPVFLFESASMQLVLQAFAIFISIVLLVHSFSADWLDIVFHKTQNDIFRTHQNCLSNTILWSAILLGVYISKDKGVFAGTGIDIRLIDLFLLSRIVFSLGYFLGACFGHQSFRSVGFGVGFGCTVVMLAEALGHSILHYFS